MLRKREKRIFLIKIMVRKTKVLPYNIYKSLGFSILESFLQLKKKIELAVLIQTFISLI